MEFGTYSGGIRPEQIDDLVELTLRKYERDTWTDISTDLQKYYAMENSLLGDRLDIRGGDANEWKVKVRNSDNAKNTGMYAVNEYNVVDVMKSAFVSWTKQTTHFSYDIDEKQFNSPDPVRILDLLKPRVHAALTDLAELMEENFWSMPNDSFTEAEQLKPKGKPYWIVRNATTGFNGGLPIGGGHANVAGLSPITYPNWQNYTGTYTTASKRDLVRKLRDAHKLTHFHEPVSHAGKQKKPRRCLATTLEIQNSLEEISEEQNENLGREMAWGALSAPVFRGVPVMWIPKLDQIHDSTGTDTANHYGRDPIYGIDKGAFKMIVQSGKFMRRHKPQIAPNQYSVRNVNYDTWMLYRCMNRRCNYVITRN